MKVKKIKIEAEDFPDDFRCACVNGTDGNRECKKGCYVQELGYEDGWYKCQSYKCGMHRWTGDSRKDDGGRRCFGPVDKRMVCVDVHAGFELL